MVRKSILFAVVLVWTATSFALLAAEPVELQSVAFPEKRAVDLPIVNRPAAPANSRSAATG